MTQVHNQNAWQIAIEYKVCALRAYCEEFNIGVEEVSYIDFKDDYFGYFENKFDFVDALSDKSKSIDNYCETYKEYMKLYRVRNGHYFSI